ncbi:MAG: hypothetical protein NC402_03430 [Prevotella sp.]|nr:hypothetical protein [Prevotella sp.]MCM1074954.1 hypothetical protein [Ruminococcus sp.]
MSKEKEKAVMALTEEPVKKQGYGIDQLRYRIALATLQKDFCKEKLINTCHTTLSRAAWSKKSGGGGAGGFVSPVVGTILKGLSYSDYIMMGLSVFKTTKNVFSFFKKKKK